MTGDGVPRHLLSMADLDRADIEQILGLSFKKKRNHQSEVTLAAKRQITWEPEAA